MRSSGRKLPVALGIQVTKLNAVIVAQIAKIGEATVHQFNLSHPRPICLSFSLYLVIFVKNRLGILSNRLCC